MRQKKIWGRTTVRGYTNSWKTLPLSKIVQENASQKNDRYWTNGQNTVLSCTVTRPVVIHQYWTARGQTQRMTILSFEGGCSTVFEEREVSLRWQHPSRTGPSRWRGCNHRCHNNLQQDLADRRMDNPVDPVLIITLPKKGNLQQHQTYWMISLISHPKSCWRSYLTDWSHKWRRSLLKNKWASEQEGAPQSRSSIYESSVRNITSTSKTSTMPS